MVITSLLDKRLGRLRCRLLGAHTVRFFISGDKYLQNSSRIQKISIKFAGVIGVDVLCNYLIFTYIELQKIFYSYKILGTFLISNSHIQRKQEKINRYIHAYFSDNAEVMMELRGIYLMFSEQEVMTIPVREYREYMTERKKEAKDKARGNKRK